MWAVLKTMEDNMIYNITFNKKNYYNKIIKFIKKTYLFNGLGSKIK